MSLWNRLQKSVAVLTGRPLPPGVSGISNGRADFDLCLDEGSILALSATWACVNLIAGTIGSLPLMVYRTDAAGNRKVAKDHPLYRVLHSSPNADQTAADFWEGGSVALELRGNMHAHIERAGDRVVALTPIFSPTVTRQADGSLRYRWSAEGKSFDEPQENVFHVRGFGGGPLGGLSTLSFGRHVFGVSASVNTAAQKTFANGLRPSGVLTADNVLRPEQRDQMEAALQEKYAGAMNAGRPMLLEAGVKWTALTIAPEDAQMLQSRRFSVEEIARLFGVPPHMIGHTENSTSWGTGLGEQTLGFQKFTLRRRLNRIEQAIEQQLLSAADRAAGVTVEFNLEGLLRADSAARAAFYKDMTSIGAMTINEVRAKENLPPVAGGDVPRMQAQNIPISLAGQSVVLNPSA